MIDPIVRIYDTAEKATAAAKKVANWGLTADMISLINTSTTGTGEGLAAALRDAHVRRDNATVLARTASAGQTLVVVRAPFGTSRVTIHILNGSGPVTTDAPTDVPDSATWDDAAPLSSALHIPTLAEWRPFGGIPTLTSGKRTLCGALGFAELSSSSAPTTEGMMALLSDSPTPFSSMLKIPLLR